MLIYLKIEKRGMYMNYLLNPPTGERPVNGWIIFLIVLAALALIGTLVAPKIPQIVAWFKKTFKK